MYTVYVTYIHVIGGVRVKNQNRAIAPTICRLHLDFFHRKLSVNDFTAIQNRTFLHLIYAKFIPNKTANESFIIYNSFLITIFWFEFIGVKVSGFTAHLQIEPSRNYKQDSRR